MKSSTFSLGTGPGVPGKLALLLWQTFSDFATTKVCGALDQKRTDKMRLRQEWCQPDHVEHGSSSGGISDRCAQPLLLSHLLEGYKPQRSPVIPHPLPISRLRAPPVRVTHLPHLNYGKCLCSPKQETRARNPVPSILFRRKYHYSR